MTARLTWLLVVLATLLAAPSYAYTDRGGFGVGLKNRVWGNFSEPGPPSSDFCLQLGGMLQTTELASTANASGVGLLFQAHLYDYETGLYLMRARVYDPRTGSFLQRDPEGFVDSVNPYAGMGWDPINLRDPTGRCVWEPNAKKQEACWNRAQKSVPAPRKCASTMAAILQNQPFEISEDNAACVFAVYSAKEGILVASDGQKQEGKDLHRDRLHRRLVKAFSQFLLKRAAGAGISEDEVPDAARRSTAAYRTGLNLAESLLGRDVNRYLYGRTNAVIPRILAQGQPVYEGLKKVTPPKYWLREDSKHPPSAVGGDYFLDRGRSDRVECESRPVVPNFEVYDGPEKERCLEKGRPRRVAVGAWKRTPVYPVTGKD